METHSKNTGFGGLSRRRCLAIWNSAAWRASKGGKSENSIAWEAVTAGKSENSLAWEAPTGGKSENSLAWGAPTGGKSENSLAWEAPTGGKFPSLGSPHGGEKWKFPSLGSPHGGEKWKFPSLGSPHGGKVKILSLGSPHGGKPPLAPLTDRNKPAVWAATPREAGWIFHHISYMLVDLIRSAVEEKTTTSFCMGVADSRWKKKQPAPFLHRVTAAFFSPQGQDLLLQNTSKLNTSTTFHN